MLRSPRRQFDNGRLDSRGATTFLEPLTSAQRGIDRTRSEKAGNVAMAEVGEVIGCGPGPGPVVNDDPGLYAPYTPIYQYHRAGAVCGHMSHEIVAKNSGRHEQTVDAALL